MACFHPKKGFQIGLTDSGGPKYRITPWDVDFVVEVDRRNHVWKNRKGTPCAVSDNFVCSGNEYDTGLVSHFVPIPCGNCIGCRLDYARDWTVRLQHELLMHKPEECWFITLTYNDESLDVSRFLFELDLPGYDQCKRVVLGADHLGEAHYYSNLEPRDMVLFWKRLRKLFPDRKLVYFQAGEYGERRGRCHFHAIVYDLPLPQDDLHFFSRNEFGQSVWRSALLENVWGLGNVIVGKVTYESCAYVARYTLKKAKEMWANDFTNRTKPFVRMSRNPGIGKLYLESHPEIFDVSRFPVSLSVKDKTLMLQHPRYYLKYLKDFNEDRYNEIKFDRAVAGINAYEQALANEKPYLEQLHDKELDFLRKASILKESRKLD